MIASLAGRSVSSYAFSSLWFHLTGSHESLSIEALGPKGECSSLNEYPVGTSLKAASLSTELSESAISCSWDTNLLWISVVLTSRLPRTRLRRYPIISSWDLCPGIQSSGVSYTTVSPCSGVIRGPAYTFGYPALPMKMEGGELPSSSVPIGTDLLFNVETVSVLRYSAFPIFIVNRPGLYSFFM
ncbi:MAG: hypothetical protein BWY05_01471 [Euryarchaeota archaeon ADurb.Bin165]|nr:MAG: hypothetical protein BWY05_01471 [Euryarchaeota archaeon ADurb.Bin165]